MLLRGRRVLEIQAQKVQWAALLSSLLSRFLAWPTKLPPKHFHEQCEELQSGVAREYRWNQPECRPGKQGNEDERAEVPGNVAPHEKAGLCHSFRSVRRTVKCGDYLAGGKPDKDRCCNKRYYR